MTDHAKMLGRKQSIKGEPILADYGPEESLNESADIEWVNKVLIEDFFKDLFHIAIIQNIEIQVEITSLLGIDF